MESPLIQQVLRAYGLAGAEVASPQRGYRNVSYAITSGSRQLNFILYKDEPGMAARIKRTHAVADFLAARHLPVRYAADKRILTLRSRQGIRYGALYNYLPGHTISWEGYTKNHLKLAGMAMARMHQVLAEMTLLDHAVTVEYQGIVRRMQRYFEDTLVQRALAAKLELKVAMDAKKLQRLLTYVASLPSQQMLHMDFVRGNLLFQKAVPTDELQRNGVALTGIIDFEKTAAGHPVVDAARTLAFLLVDCKYKPADKVVKYFMQSGYVKHGGAIGFSPRLLHELVTLFLIHDFYKFLRHNPYEFLGQNEHFVRTRDMLLERGVVRYIQRGAKEA